MRILVTGSNGVLGRALVAELRNRNHEVWGCDLFHCDDAYYIRADISDAQQLDRAFSIASPALTYGLAAEFGRLNGEAYPRQLWTSNCLGLSNTIDLCLKYASRLVFASSSEAYGDLADRHDILREGLLRDEVPNFHCEYALSKLVGEHQLQIARTNSGLKAVALRFFNCYGMEPYTPYRSVVCNFIYRLLHRLPITVYAQCHRDFLYISDWARTVANVADRFDQLRESAYNIGGNDYRSIRVLAQLVLKACGYDPGHGSWDGLVEMKDVEPANIQNKRPDIALAVRDLDHAPRVRLEEGVELTVAWMRKRYGLQDGLQDGPQG